MQWSFVKSWAKEQGFSANREKNSNHDEQNNYNYYWFKIDDPSVSGISISVSKTATAIFNQMTNNVHCDYQKKYQETKNDEDIDHNELSGSW